VTRDTRSIVRTPEASKASMIAAVTKLIKMTFVTKKNDTAGRTKDTEVVSVQALRRLQMHQAHPNRLQAQRAANRNSSHQERPLSKTGNR
jgi:hypothetical protein